MRLAIPTWNNRVSPVFDTAAQVLVVDIDNGRIHRQQTLNIDQIPGCQRGEWLMRAGIGTLICGAVSSPQEAVLNAAGIDVIPWVRGAVDDVISAYVSGDLDRQDFRLPGYCNMRQHRRRGRIRRRAQRSVKQNRENRR